MAKACLKSTRPAAKRFRIVRKLAKRHRGRAESKARSRGEPSTTGGFRREVARGEKQMLDAGGKKEEEEKKTVLEEMKPV